MTSTSPLRHLLVTALLSVSCSDDSADGGAEPAAVRGELLSLTPIASLTASDVASYLAGFDIDSTSARFAIDAYRVEYRTVDPGGERVRASALLALPVAGNREPDQVVWMHGTTVYKGDVASMSEDNDGRAASFFFAAAGYAVTAPDYVGLGLGEGTHPYDHIPSEVTAGIDALRAVRAAAGSLGRNLGARVSLSGHSQGGPGAVALAQEIQNGGGAGLVLAGLAPISGPYDMSTSLTLAARGGIAYASAYLAYLTIAWNRWIGLYDSPSDAFLPPYDQTLLPLFDNTHTTQEVFAGLPEQLEELFTPVFLAQLREPTGALERALEQASRVCAWRPVASVAVYASSADTEVPIENARHCLSSFGASGAAVPLIDLGDADHSASLSRSLPLVLAQFAQ